MKPHPRIRKMVKWSATVGAALLVVLWAWSQYRFVWWIPGENTMVEAVSGRVGFAPTDPVDESKSRWRWSTGPNLVQLPTAWSFGRNRWIDPYSIAPTSEFVGHFYWVPVWPGVLVLSLVAGALWVLDARASRLAQAGLCPRCNYDRVGLAKGAVCPECGSPPRASA